MTGLENAAYAALTALVTSTYPGLTTVIREEQLGRVNWENLVSSGSLTAPFAVIRVGASEPQDWGLDNLAFRWSVTVTLVVSIADTSASLTGGGTDVTAYLLQQLGLLRAAFISYTGGAFQLVAEHPVLDASVRSEANRVLLNLLAGFQAGELSVEMLVGQSP